VSASVEIVCTRDAEGFTRVWGDTPARLPAEARCAHCGDEHGLVRERITPAGGLVGCVSCGHPELYTLKEFPRKLGISIVVVAAVLAPFTYYISLFVAAALDAALYALAPNMVMCYVCHGAHRGFAAEPSHPRFDREIDERLKFGARAVMGKPMRPGGTAGAPEPEH
jgi:hypothetical protein